MKKSDYGRFQIKIDKSIASEIIQLHRISLSILSLLQIKTKLQIAPNQNILWLFVMKALKVTFL